MDKSEACKILIIGGSGFVGSRLISTIGKKNCLNFDKNLSPFYPDITEIIDIRNANDIIIPKNISTVILLAAEHKDNVSPQSLYYDVNVNGTLNVLKSIDNSRVKNLIFTSSVAVYGLNKNNPSEENEKDPFNHYGKSKLKAEEIIEKWYKESSKNKSITIIRPTVIFGERNRGNVYNLFNQIISGKFMMIGNGENKKSMAYVGNVVELLKHFSNNPLPGLHIFNYSDKPDHSMKELVDLIRIKSGLSISKFSIPIWLGMLIGYFFDFLSFVLIKKLTISSVRVKKFCSETQFDAKKIHSIFNPPFSFEDAINRTLDFDFKKKDNV